MVAIKNNLQLNFTVVQSYTPSKSILDTLSNNYELSRRYNTSYELNTPSIIGIVFGSICVIGLLAVALIKYWPKKVSV